MSNLDSRLGQDVKRQTNVRLTSATIAKQRNSGERGQEDGARASADEG